MATNSTQAGAYKGVALVGTFATPMLASALHASILSTFHRCLTSRACLKILFAEHKHGAHVLDLSFFRLGIHGYVFVKTQERTCAHVFAGNSIDTKIARHTRYFVEGSVCAHVMAGGVSFERVC